MKILRTTPDLAPHGLGDIDLDAALKAAASQATEDAATLRAKYTALADVQLKSEKLRELATTTERSRSRVEVLKREADGIRALAESLKAEVKGIPDNRAARERNAALRAELEALRHG